MDSSCLITEEYERKLLRDRRIILVSGELCSGEAHEFIEDIRLLMEEGTTEPIEIIIASPGGDAFSGVAMSRAINSAQKMGIEVIGNVHGYACSMAFLLLQTCDTRKMGKLDVLMAHGVTTGFTGDMRNIEAETKLLNFWHAEWSELLAKRCSGEASEAGWWYEILKDNTPQWYTANDCIKMGLIDEVEDANNKD